MNRITSTHLAAAILCVGLLTTATANASPPVTHTGACEVNSSGKLNGYCLSSCPPYEPCCSGASTDCKTGRRAKVIKYVVCGFAQIAYDPKKICRF